MTVLSRIAGTVAVLAVTCGPNLAVPAPADLPDVPAGAPVPAATGRTAHRAATVRQTRPDGWTQRLRRWERVRQAIVACESNGNPTAANPTSSASGLYQFVDGTWRWVTGLPAPAAAHPPAVQHRAFWRLWDQGRGATHWQASQSCWEGAR